MKSGLLLDVVVRKSSAIFQLFSSKDQPLLIWWDSFLVLNLGLHILNGVRRLNFQSDSLSSESLDKDLHSSPETENQMKSGLLLDVVVRKSSAIFQLFSNKDLHSSSETENQMKSGLLLNVVVRKCSTIFQLL